MYDENRAKNEPNECQNSRSAKTRELFNTLLESTWCKYLYFYWTRCIYLVGGKTIFCVKYIGALGETATELSDVVFISDELDHYCTNVFVSSTSCITKSSGTLYNFVFHISCSTCTSSVPYIYVALHLSVYYIYTCYIYTHTLISMYIYVLYPISFST